MKYRLPTTSEIRRNKNLTLSERMVLGVIRDFINTSTLKDGTDYCFASTETLIKEAGVSIRSVENGLKRLEELELIRRETENAFGFNKRKIFIIMFIENEEGEKKAKKP